MLRRGIHVAASHARGIGRVRSRALCPLSSSGSGTFDQQQTHRSSSNRATAAASSWGGAHSRKRSTSVSNSPKGYARRSFAVSIEEEGGNPDCESAANDVTASNIDDLISAANDAVDYKQDHIGDALIDSSPDGSSETTDINLDDVSVTDINDLNDNESNADEEIVSPVQNLQNETQRFLKLMHPKNSEDSDIAEQRSKLDYSDFDKLFEEWSKVYEISEKDSALAAASAHSLLEALEDQYDRCFALACESGTSEGISWSLVPRSDVCYNLVLQAYAMSNNGLDAQNVLVRMMERCKKYAADMESASITPPPTPPPEPSVRSFNIAMNAWARSQDEECGSRAEAVFRMMELWNHECQQKDEDVQNRSSLGSYYSGVRPSVQSFSSVINAWANCNAGIDTVVRVRAIVDQMIEKRKVALADAPKADGADVDNSAALSFVKPNRIIFNAAINAIGKNGKGLKGAENAEKLLDRMSALDESGELGIDDDHNEDDVGLKPNTLSFSTVLDAYARCADDDIDGLEAVTRAEKLLLRMEEMYALEGYDVKPNAICFTEVITALARSGDYIDNAPARAEALLDRLIELYKDSGEDKEMEPTAKTYNSVITAYARSQIADKVEKAQAVFDRLCEFSSPVSSSYAAMIDVYAKSHKADAGAKALEILEKMENDDTVDGDSYSYNSTINALARSDAIDDAAEKALSLLQKMEDAYAQGNENLKPDRFSYTSALNALARTSKMAGIPSKARQILDRFLERGTSNVGDRSMRPDTFVFTTCINACSSVYTHAEKRTALITAIQTFEELKSSNYGDPNQFTYAYMIKACARLGADDNERDRLLRATFNECCEEGQVSKMALMWFKRGSSQKLKQEVFGDLQGNESREGIIPHQWTRNVKRKDAPRDTADHKDGRTQYR